MGVRSFLTFSYFSLHLMYKPRSFEMNSHAKIFWPWFRITMSREKISIFAISCGFLNILIMIIHFNSKFLMTDSIVFNLKCRFRLICHFQNEINSCNFGQTPSQSLWWHDTRPCFIFSLNWIEEKMRNLLFDILTPFCFDDGMWFINRRQHWKKSYETIKTVWPKKTNKINCRI
jgi:hypothetical protein